MHILTHRGPVDVGFVRLGVVLVEQKSSALGGGADSRREIGVLCELVNVLGEHVDERDHFVHKCACARRDLVRREEEWLRKEKYQPDYSKENHDG